MKRISLLIFSIIIFGCSRTYHKPDLRYILLEQLRNTYTNKNWFVPLKVAVKDLSADKINWKDSTNNHSIGQLMSHIIFWNERVLISFQGNTPPNFDDNNESTFVNYDGNSWENNLVKLDSIQLKWEKVIGKASDSQIRKWSSEVANMCSHVAYHTGQIIYIRKQNGCWEESNGVK